MIALCIALLCVGGTMAFALNAKRRAASKRQTQTPASATPANEDIFAHRTWTQVNPQRFRMNMFTASLCRMPTPVDEAMEAGGPHRDKFVTVYVNDTGKSSMMTERYPKFPVGSMIVKEKFSTVEGGSPELMTAMLKREAGYNPKTGDWEYLVLNGEGTKIEARGKLDDCMACHALLNKQDFVYRSYLPASAFSGMR
jgi:hypothetical protein